MNQIINKEDKFFYGDYLAELKEAQKIVIEMVERYNEIEKMQIGKSSIESYKSRIKSAKSMKNKLAINNLPITCEKAITELTDTVGIRIICRFIDDVYVVANWFSQQDNLEVIAIKDYISCAKPNGYRSYHMITQLTIHNQKKIFVELQMRTISQDCWASLEHQMKYKKEIKNQKIIQDELKRCADEMASTDISMQTIKELISEV